MKNLFTLMLLIICLAAESQPPGGDRSVILIRNNRTVGFSRITKFIWISVRTKSGASLSGMVRSVKADTIFFKDTLLQVTDIDSLFLQRGPSGFDPHSNQSRRNAAYVAGSPDWLIIYPPDSVYTNAGTFHIYYTQLVRQARQYLHEIRSPLLFSNFLKFNVTKLIHLELAFSYERLITKKFTWETELSAIFGVASADAHYMINYPLYNYSGFSVTTNPKFYIINSRTYLAPVFMYRYLWVLGMRTGWPDQKGNSTTLQDQYRNDFGLSLRNGVMKRYGKFVIEYYIGGGIKYILLQQLEYGIYPYRDSGTMYWLNKDHSANVSYQQLFGPVINAGIKIGFAF
jgi:hypothetical protein